MDTLLEAHDYIVGYGQMIMEVLRNLRCHLLAHGDEWLHDFSMQDSPLSPSSSFLTTDGPRAGSGRRRGGGMMGGVASLTSRMSSSSLADMPPLEETDPNKLKQEQEGKDPYAHFYKENTDPLPPAFLKDEDYPPGWLVYDPILGVVSKEEADKYHIEQKAKRKQQQQQNVEKEEDSLKQPAKSPARREQQQQEEEQTLDRKEEPSKIEKLSDEKASTATKSPARAKASIPKASETKVSQKRIAASG